jgi:hypothetical protein
LSVALSGCFSEAPALDQAADSLRFRKLATDEYTGAVRTYRLIVRVALCNSEDLAGLIYRSLVVLRDDKGAGEY